MTKDNVQDIPDLIAGALGVSRGTAYDMMLEALKEATPVQEPVAWTDLLKQAEEVVRSKSLWKKYIDGTPLANDIAVWMANFAQEHTTPPAAQRQWVGLTDEDYVNMGISPSLISWQYRAIEAKLKEKNT
jgi:hypothetical protein